MTTINANWDSNGDAAPYCDDCGAICARGYSMRWKDDKVDKVWCLSCRDRRDLLEWRETQRLTSNFVTTTILKYMGAQSNNDSGVARVYEDPRKAITTVELAVKRFCETAWPIVHAQVNDERLYKGMRVDVDGLTILAFAMCGRIRVQVERGDVWCSGQGAEEDYALGFGLHGIGATADEAATLWGDAINAFKGGAQLVGTPSVGI